MTITEKANAIEQNYKHEIANLNRFYDLHINALPVNACGEVIAEKLAELNEWHNKLIIEIRNKWINAMLSLLKGEQS